MTGGGTTRRSEPRAQTKELKHDEVRPELIMLQKRALKPIAVGYDERT
jgi:hypothetical protein